VHTAAPPSKQTTQDVRKGNVLCIKLDLVKLYVKKMEMVRSYVEKLRI